MSATARVWSVLAVLYVAFFGWYTSLGGALDLWGIEGAEQWSMGGLVRYRSRRDLMEQVKPVAS